MATPEQKRRKIESENRGFHSEWTKNFFFVEHCGKPLCLLCETSLAVFKEYNVKRHYDSHHKDTYHNMPAELRELKIAELKRKLGQQKTLGFFTSRSASNEAAVSASYKVALLIAERCKPFQDAEFVKDCMLECAKTVCPKQEQKFKDISLSRKTVTSRISEMSTESKSQLTNASTSFRYFSIALDESTDASDTAQLLLYVRGVSDDFVVTEELLKLCPMKSTTKGRDVAAEVIAAIDDLDLPWDRLVGITTDGAPAMKGKREGAATLVSQHASETGNNDDVMKYHCIIHQEVLCSKTIGFNDVMKSVVSDVNFIRARALNHRQFKTFLEEVDAAYGDICFYTEVRWLSKGKVLKHVLALNTEICQFMEDNGRETQLGDDHFLCDVAFLADITRHLNELNVALQGKNRKISDLYSSVKAFKSKLRLFLRHIGANNFAHFPHLKQREDDGVAIDTQPYVDALVRLTDEFNTRFEDFSAYVKDFANFVNPFNADVEESQEILQMELIDLQSSVDYNSLFKQTPNVVDFYKVLPENAFPELRKFAQKLLSLFGSTYICEQTFSLMKLTKSKSRTRLTDDHLEACLRLATTSLYPDIAKLVANHQCQTSH